MPLESPQELIDHLLTNNLLFAHVMTYGRCFHPSIEHDHRAGELLLVVESGNGLTYPALAAAGFLVIDSALGLVRELIELRFGSGSAPSSFCLMNLQAWLLDANIVDPSIGLDIHRRLFAVLDSVDDTVVMASRGHNHVPVLPSARSLHLQLTTLRSKIGVAGLPVRRP